MKLFIVAFAVIAAVAADVSHLPTNEYLPPVQDAFSVAPTNEYLPPVANTVEQGELAADGYRYKTHRRTVLRRHRRDVNELSNEYLPPVQETVVAAPTNEYLAPVDAEPAHELAADGYRYKTHRRVIRRRRDVNELSNEYLPPVAAPTSEYLPPVAAVEAAPVAAVEAAPAHELAADGYRYKTVRRVIRRRRDVNELSNEYLPPVEAPIAQDVAIDSAPLADDGYRYKTVRRVIRRRRDVNELSNEYLPPVQDTVVAAPTNEYLAPVDAEPAHELAADGYRYKTHRRVIRRRRDVNELSNEYLPPVAAPTSEYLPPVAAVEAVEAAPAHELAADGYRYKTVRRVIRRRRDVNELPTNEYLPPVAAPTSEYLPPVAAVEAAPVAAVEAAPAHELAADGYRYKTHRRVVYRRH
ncbi:early nodulin-75 isoform X2 [Drosophila busckii]|uniref:early nodulin-75 isoform X2 n=1 Tax=Drosophila busckii TaxID=30019 RepID=UPI0014328FD5|nr:early nodulin-75 isoform X2 [Drosophila busckii]